MTLQTEIQAAADSAMANNVRTAATATAMTWGRRTAPTYGVSEQLAELFRENVNGTLGTEIACRAALPPPGGRQSH